jgi:nitroreductase
VALRSSSRVEVFIEPSRCLPNLDPRFRQAVISIGAFLENFDLAAKYAGFISDLTCFPAGWPEPKLDIRAPVGRIDLVPDKDVMTDPLFQQITTRRSHRRSYKREEVDPEFFGKIAGSFDSDPVPIAFGYTSDPGLKNEIAGYLVKAMEVELSHHARYSEIMSWIRSSSKKHESDTPGLTFSQLGLSALAVLYARLMMKILYGSGREEFIKRTLIALARKQADSAAAFGWIATREDHRITQIRAGRVFERIHLAASSIGLSLHPMTQVIRDYEDMKRLKKEFQGVLGIPETHSVQMFFRLGYSGSESAVPRLPVEDFTWNESWQ